MKKILFMFVISSSMMLSSCAILEEVLIILAQSQQQAPQQQQQEPTTDANNKGDRTRTNGPAQTETRNTGDGMKDVETTNDRIETDGTKLERKSNDQTVDNVIKSLGVTETVGRQLRSILEVSANERKMIVEKNKGDQAATSRAISRLDVKTNNDIKSILTPAQYSKFVDMSSKEMKKMEESGPVKTGSVIID